MFRDPQFVITFQLALIGVVLIGGLFLIWKAISRIEEKVEMLLVQQDAKAMGAFKLQLDNNGLHVQKCEEDSSGCCPMSMMASDPLMQKLFQEHQESMEEEEGEDTTPAREEFVFFSRMETPFDIPDGEDHTELEPPKVTIEEVPMKPEHTPSELSEAAMGGTLSKNKLRLMNLDKLRNICEERNLSSEGTKNQLIERILEA